VIYPANHLINLFQLFLKESALNPPTRLHFLVTRTSDEISLFLMQKHRTFDDDVTVLAELIGINLKEQGFLSIVKTAKTDDTASIIVITRCGKKALKKLIKWGAKKRELETDLL
jgi:hypothetical protein